ncbi:MAG: hypothetical protein LIO46_03855 [Clostridiales bacterium]|nr:hypothetical protein [Clostridiales bacterium]
MTYIKVDRQNRITGAAKEKKEGYIEIANDIIGHMIANNKLPDIEGIAWVYDPEKKNVSFSIDKKGILQRVKSEMEK